MITLLRLQHFQLFNKVGFISLYLAGPREKKITAEFLRININNEKYALVLLNITLLITIIINLVNYSNILTMLN